MLDVKTRNEINRLRVHGYAVSGIAASLGLSVNTVKSYIHRHPTVDGFIICPECKTAFPRENAKRKTKKFCSDACRMAWWNKNLDKVKRSAYYTLTCKRCKKEFISYGNKNRKFCCRACYDEYRK